MDDLAAARCPECGARWMDGLTCAEAFYQMLAWENEEPALGVVHHLTVLGYYLQHPSHYSPDGLRYSLGLLVDFVERGLDPAEARRRSRGDVDSGKRGWKVTARPDMQGAYANPPGWTMTAVDVAAGGKAGYVENVNCWARAILATLRESGNIG